MTGVQTCALPISVKRDRGSGEETGVTARFYISMTKELERGIHDIYNSGEAIDQGCPEKDSVLFFGTESCLIQNYRVY